MGPFRGILKLSKGFCRRVESESRGLSLWLPIAQTRQKSHDVRLLLASGRIGRQGNGGSYPREARPSSTGAHLDSAWPEKRAPHLFKVLVGAHDFSIRYLRIAGPEKNEPSTTHTHTHTAVLPARRPENQVTATNDKKTKTLNPEPRGGAHGVGITWFFFLLDSYGQSQNQNGSGLHRGSVHDTS